MISIEIDWFLVDFCYLFVCFGRITIIKSFFNYIFKINIDRI